MSGPRAKKRFGQHFLSSQDVINRIIESILSEPELPVVEIGPGRGALTIPLAEAGVELLAVEFDRDVAKYLKRQIAPHKNVVVKQADFLSLEADDIPFEKFQLIGNLPYNISSPIIDWTVANRSKISSALFMLQKEMAARVSSEPGTKDWSPMAILTGLHFDVEHQFNVSAAAFEPPPKVESAVIRLRARSSIVAGDLSLFETVVRQAFAQRRKLLVNNIVPGLIDNAEAARLILNELGLPPNVRAEQVSTEKFFELTERLRSYKMIDSGNN